MPGDDFTCLREVAVGSLEINSRTLVFIGHSRTHQRYGGQVGEGLKDGDFGLDIVSESPRNFDVDCTERHAALSLGVNRYAHEGL